MTPIEWYFSIPALSQLLIIYLVGINIITFFSFGIDKLAASLGHRRTPEKTLWILTALGGSIGALLGMEFFKHKRRKASFYSVIMLCFLFHICIVLLLLY